MTIDQRPQSWIKHTLFIGIIAALTACGGSGGGGGGPTPGPDTPPDTTPNAFTLNVVDDAVPGAEVISEPFTVSGINAPTPISIEGGQYAVNGGAYTSAAGTVRNGDTVRVKVTSSGTLQTDVKATLTIGGVAGTFIVTTLADTTAPIAQITFPPPMSLKEAETILVRGIASDDYSGIKSLTVNGVEAEFSDETNWTATVPLNEGANDIVVKVVDESGNADDEAAVVVVHRGEEDGEFPDDSAPITYGSQLTFDQANNRLLVTNRSTGGGVASVIAVDFLTGSRSILSDRTRPNNEVEFQRPLGIVIDANADRNRAIIADAGDLVIAMDLTDGSRTILSDGTTPSSDQPRIDTPNNIVLDPNDSDTAYMVDTGARNVQKINLVSGERTLISDNSMADTGPMFEEPSSIMIDVSNNRALVADGYSELAALFSVDLATGVRTIISDLDSPQNSMRLYGAGAMVSDNLSQYVLIDTALDGIIKVNLDTGEKTQFFKPFYSSPGYIIHGLHLEPEYSYLFYMDNRTRGVYAIDLKSAEYVVISKSEVRFD